MTALEKLTAWFKAQIGTRETGENNVIYNTRYYGGPVSGSQYPWCCAFIWDGFHETGLSNLFCGGAKTAYCPYVVNYAKQHNQWVTDNYRHGDIMLFDWNGDGVADHIGFVLAWYGSYAVTIEGNAEDAVKECTRYPSNILGAYRPSYPSEASAQGEKTYTVQKGDSLWAIAEKFYGNGLMYQKIADYNHLTSTRLSIGQILKIPVEGAENTGNVGTTPIKPSENVSVALPVLERGNTGFAVRNLQSMLRVRGYELDVDGDFGGVTIDRLKAFQNAAGLPQSGKTDAKTWETMFK